MPRSDDLSADASLLRHADFLRLWGTRLSGQAASQMMMVAMAWQMYELTGSALDLGLVGLAQFLPALLFTLPGGHVADRAHRGRILAGTTTTLLAVAAILTLASAQGWVGRSLLLGLSLLIGLVRAFQMPAMQALTPQLVPMTLLPRAIAANASAGQIASIGGPALGGVLVALGMTACYAVCLACFAVAGVLAATIRVAPPAGAQDDRAGALLAGVRFIRERPVLLGALSLDLFAVLFGGAVALLPVFARDVLHTGAWGLGLLRAAPAVGALLTSIWLAHHPIRRRAGRLLFGGVAVYGVATLGFALSTLFWPSFVLLAVSGAADMVSVVVRSTLVQLETPDAMRGRVSAVNSVFIGASNQLGEFESGATAAWLGPVGSVVLGGAATLCIVALWVRLFPTLWQRERLDRADD